MYQIQDGKIALHSYDSDPAPSYGSEPLLTAASLISWGLNSSENNPVDRTAYHQAVAFAMDLLTNLGNELQSSHIPSQSSNISTMELHHIHLCWKLNSSAKIKNISIHTIHNTSGYLQEQQTRLIKVFYPLFNETLAVDKGNTNTMANSSNTMTEAERMNALSDWQKLLLKLAFSGYCQQTLDLDKPAYSMRYHLHSMDARPLLLNKVMSKLLRLQQHHFPYTIPRPSPSPSPANPSPSPSSSSQLADALPSNPTTTTTTTTTAQQPMDLPSAIFQLQSLSDAVVYGTELIGRGVRRLYSSLVDLSAAYHSLSTTTNPPGRLSSPNIEVFVDPESADMTTILLTALFPLSCSSTVTQYILQGLYILGVDIQHDWNALHAQQLVPSNSLLPVLLPDHALPTSSPRAGQEKKVQMILTLGKDATWLQYRVRTLVQQFPGHPVCGVLTCPSSSPVEGVDINSQLPKQAVIVSADDVMEEVWRQF